MFEVSLIPNQGTKATKTFRLRGVTDAYEQFDHPELNNPAILHHVQLLEKALVAPIHFQPLEGYTNEQGNMILRYVKLPEPDRRARAREPKQKGKIDPISF